MSPSDAIAVSAPTYSHQQILRVVTGIMLCILLAALDQTVVIPAVPAIASELNAFGHLSWIVSAYLLTSTAATPIYGKLSDIYGRRALLLPALALFIVASILCALAANLPQLIAFRALQGVGGAGLMSMAQAAIADVVSPRERGRYQGYMASMWGVASVGGPIVGGFITDHLSWNYVFWINVPIGLAAMWLCNRALRLLPVRHMKAKIDYLGAALLTSGVTAWLLVLSWGGSEYPWGSPVIVGLSLVGLVLFAALAMHERRVQDAILPPRMFANPVFSRGVLLAFLTSLGLLGTTFLLPLFFQLIRGADASGSGLLIMPFLVFNVIGAYVGGQATRRLGRTKAIILGGLVASVLGFAGLVAVGRDTPFVLVFLAMGTVGLGIGVCMPNVLVMVQNAAERRDVGTATGALLFLRSMGGAFGTTMVGALLTLQFASGLAAAGITTPVDLGSMRDGGALAALGPAAQAAGVSALAGGFRLAFGGCLALTLLAVVIAMGVKDLPLRTTAGSDPEATPAAMGH
ncbi:MAG: MDR family MFS transporter [Acetobacteraceae bacterium]